MTLNEWLTKHYAEKACNPKLKDYRLGQDFCNLTYDCESFDYECLNHTFPTLFYETDDEKALQMIENWLEHMCVTVTLNNLQRAYNMATLAELLIQANINPFELPSDVEYIAQDSGFTSCVFTYSTLPHLAVSGCSYESTYTLEEIEGFLCTECSSDWQTPLHIDTYKQAWEAAKKNNVKEEEIIQEYPAHEWPKIMQLINKIYDSDVLIVEFKSEWEGVVLQTNLRWYEKGYISTGWNSCKDANTWEPYTGTEFKLPVEATQTPSAALLPSSEPMTAQDIVKLLQITWKLAELECQRSDIDVLINEANKEYANLKEQLLTLI